LMICYIYIYIGVTIHEDNIVDSVTCQYVKSIRTPFLGEQTLKDLIKYLL